MRRAGQGGWNFNALKFAVNHTVCTLEAFPCTGKGNGTQCSDWSTSSCSGKEGALVKGSLAGWKSVGAKKWGSTTEADLMSALQHGPVSILNKNRNQMICMRLGSPARALQL